MGYLSRLECSVQPGGVPPLPVSREPESKPVPTRPAAKKPTAPAAAPVTVAGENSTPPAVQLDAPVPTDDTAARQAHEAAEVQRRAEWEAKQQAKRAAEQGELNRLAAMSDEDAVAASMQRVSEDTEKLTRRNMKDCVSEHVQVMCHQDPDFARKVLRPSKSMVHCFRYINRKAREFVQEEMKASDIQPKNGIYGSDVPDDLCYQWAVDYFNDPDAPEDKEKEEKFVPTPYVAKSSVTKPASKPKAKKEYEKKAAAKSKPQAGVDGQLSFMGTAG